MCNYVTPKLNTKLLSSDYSYITPQIALLCTSECETRIHQVYKYKLSNHFKSEETLKCHYTFAVAPVNSAFILIAVAKLPRQQLLSIL